MLCRVTLEEQKQSDCKTTKRRSPRKDAEYKYKRRSPSESSKTKYNKKTLRKNAEEPYKPTSSSTTRKDSSSSKSVSESDEGMYKEITGSSSDSVCDTRFWQRVYVAMEEYRRVPSSCKRLLWDGTTYICPKIILHYYFTQLIIVCFTSIYQHKPKQVRKSK